jgi:hypothetical protein
MSKIISLIKRIIRNITPPFIITTFKTLKRKTQKFYSKKVNLDLIDFQNFDNTEVYILGNSPSLSQVNIEDFYGKTIFVCNHFYKHPKFNQLKEKCKIIYFTQDPIQSHINIAKERNLELKEVVRDYLDEILSPNYETILNKSVFDFIKNNNLYLDCKASYYNPQLIFQIFNEKLKQGRVELEKAINIRQTPNAMITYAFIHGFKTINLFGLQHTYVLDKIKNSEVSKHFYSDGEESLKNTGLTELFYDSYLTFNVYKEQAKLAFELNVEIFDCTMDGLLDMFPKKVNTPLKLNS